MLTIQGNRYFIKDSKPFFYLADTCWSAFTNIAEKDWTYYLQTRKQQGFNVLQINVLAQWDASSTDLDYLPYATKTDGTFDFSQKNDAYFLRAEKMVAEAHAAGFTVALVLLWCNYLPDTWATNLRKTSILPYEYVEEYVTYVTELFKPYQPIYMISGDTDFPSEVVNDYYELALQTVKKNDADALTTLHIRGREMAIPERLQQNEHLDFYMFQSGHNVSHLDMSYLLAESFYQKEPKRPALNAEPCYEQMGYSRRIYGRFTRYDVRKAAWQSILAGGTAGITYGAHGIWSWHQSQLTFDSTVGEAFEQPYDWHAALQFPGAWDYGYIKQVFENYDIPDIKPVAIIANDTTEIRAAGNDTHILIYVPSNINVKLTGDFSSYTAKIIALESKKSIQTNITYNKETAQSVIPMHPFIEDVLIVLSKKEK